MQNRKRDTDVQSRLWDSVGEGEGGMFRDFIIIYFFLHFVRFAAELGILANAQLDILSNLEDHIVRASSFPFFGG